MKSLCTNSWEWNASGAMWVSVSPLTMGWTMGENVKLNSGEDGALYLAPVIALIALFCALSSLRIWTSQKSSAHSSVLINI